MKRELKEVKVELNVVQITTIDERWYHILDRFVPSSTWIAGYYPKGIAFYKWLADKGWDEAEAIKSAAGDKGSKVHSAISQLLKGGQLKMDDRFLNPSTNIQEELSVDEWDAIVSFQSWWEETKPSKILKMDATVYNEKENYAGTLDLLCQIENEIWLIDFKTSQYIWPEHELQLSSYLHALSQPAKMAILQIGYKRNKNRFKFTEIEDKFNLFLAAKQIWTNECAGEKPSQKDYPLTLKLTIKGETDAKDQ